MPQSDQTPHLEGFEHSEDVELISTVQREPSLPKAYGTSSDEESKNNGIQLSRQES